MREVEELVMRNSNDEVTFAIVSASVADDVSSILYAVQKAVSRWVDKTSEGREAYKRSGEDFNVGDLHAELLSPIHTSVLRDMLRAYGVFGLKIEVHSHRNASPYWTYDTHLYQEGEWYSGGVSDAD